MAVLPGTMFRVALANQHLVLAHASGRSAPAIHPPDDRRPGATANVALRYREGADCLPARLTLLK